MRKKIMYFGSLLVVTTALLISCIKPGGSETTSTLPNYFDVQNGTLVKKDKPFSTTELGITVNMNPTVIPGGTSIVDVQSPSRPKRLYVGVEDVTGYYEVIPEETSGVYSCILIINQDIDLGEEDSFVVWIAALDNNDEISETWEKEVSLHEVGTGQLQVSLSFNNDKDVDLHLFEPNGEHIYYSHRMSSNGGQLDLDSNPGCNIDGINNENITYGEDAYIEPGTYTVYVDMYSNCDETIATDYVVTVTYGGRLVNAQTGSNPARGTFPVGTESNHNNLDNLQPVMTFTIDNKGQVKTKNFDPLPLTESAIEKMRMAE